jgi:UDP-N-acetyl-D-mannosaminuronate dehydrogenase/intein/homing endonuclease
MSSQPPLSLEPGEIAVRIRDGALAIGVVGLGWMGLPTACLYAEMGAKVIGADMNPKVVERVSKGDSTIDEPGLSPMLKKAIKAGKFTATTSTEEAAANSDILFLVVPTMIDRQKRADYSAVEDACVSIGKGLRNGSLVIFESTCGPGVTERVVKGTVEKYSGLVAGQGFGLAYSPIRAMGGRALQDMQTYSKVVGATDKKSLEAACASLSVIVKGELIRTRDIKTAELTKLFETIYRDVNIALANEFALLCEEMGVDYLETMRSANSQPYSHLHSTGAGVGGHCLAPGEFVFATNSGSFGAMAIEPCVEKAVPKPHDSMSSEIREPPKATTRVLSFDLQNSRAEVSEVEWLSKRKYSGELIKIRTDLGRELTVTPDHPMITWANGSFAVTPAGQLRIGDRLAIATDFPWKTRSAPLIIDLIEALSKRELTSGYKVKLRKGTLRNFKKTLGPRLRLLGTNRSERQEFLRQNYLPLGLYVRLEQTGSLPFDRSALLLYRGRGRVTFVPAVIRPDHRFWRLVGYYLSEGCVTHDKTLRVRFTFNKKEDYLSRDVIETLESIGVKYSESITGNVRELRVSSRAFGFLFKDLLGCGVGSHDKRIPSLLFEAGKDAARNVLSGLIRGDGGIEDSGHGACIEFATVSSTLYQQSLVLLQGLGFVPSLRRINGKKSTSTAHSLRILGFEQLRRATDLLVGPPRRQLESALSKYSRIRRKLRFTPKGSFALLAVNRIHRTHHDGFVYNMEVNNTHTFITSGGIITHNCLPVYPYLLNTEAFTFDARLRLVLDARKINDFMPRHVAKLASDGLRVCGKSLKRAKVLVLGVSYRPNVKETRYSPSLDLISILKKRGAKVTAFDPLYNASEMESMGLQSEPTLRKAIEKADCAILAVAHEELKNLDTIELAAHMSRQGLIVDCTGSLDSASVEKSGLVYRGTGRGLWTR